MPCVSILWITLHLISLPSLHTAQGLTGQTLPKFKYSYNFCITPSYFFAHGGAWVAGLQWWIDSPQLTCAHHQVCQGQTDTKAKMSENQSWPPSLLKPRAFGQGITFRLWDFLFWVKWLFTVTFVKILLLVDSLLACPGYLNQRSPDISICIFRLPSIIRHINLHIIIFVFRQLLDITLHVHNKSQSRASNPFLGQFFLWVKQHIHKSTRQQRILHSVQNLFDFNSSHTMNDSIILN